MSFHPPFAWFTESETITRDEYGNLTVTRVHVVPGNKCGTAWSDPIAGDRGSMQNNKSVLSRSTQYDRELQITRITETFVTAYGGPENSKISFEAQSGMEDIRAHPDFDDLAGTPEEPKLDQAIWVSENNDDTDFRFVEFTGSLAGVSQYITGTGNVLKETWTGTADSFSNVENIMGKIAQPSGRAAFGTTTTWICSGAEIEPFGEQYRITVSYKSAASEIWGRGGDGGWNPTLY